jgi:hypothetical protein
MDRRAESAPARGDPLIEAMARVLRLARRVNHLEAKLGRLRRREHAAFHALDRLRDADEALGVVADRHGRGISDRTVEGTAGE